MNKEFIPHKQSLDLQELGFDEPCLAFFEINNTHQPQNLRYFLKTAVNREYIENTKILKYIYGENSLLAPLYQQAFRWFREKYDLVIEPCVPFQRLYSTEEDHFEILEFGYRIYSFDQYRGGLRDKIEWDGYDNSNEEETELECLKKLIEIVKSK